MTLMPKNRTLAAAPLAGLVVMLAFGSACGATWEEPFDGKFSKNYYVEPQAKGQGWNHTRINPATGYSGKAGEVSIVKAPVRKGSGAMRCVSKDGKRMELELVNRGEKDSPRLNQHSWAGISILFPAAAAPTGGFCIQWHGGMPNKAQGKEYARGPEAALRISGRQLIYWNNFKESKSAEGGKRRATLVEDVQPGRWYDFVFHHYFSLKDDGLIEIWVNGKKVYTEKGCNAFYYRSQFAFKFGLYGSGSKGAIFFDEAKVMTGAGSYEEVAPGGAKAVSADGGSPGRPTDAGAPRFYGFQGPAAGLGTVVRAIPAVPGIWDRSH